MEYNATKLENNLALNKINCITPEYCETKLKGKVIDNKTCEAEKTECTVYQAKSPSSMLRFCNNTCEYEETTSDDGPISVCSDCENMWRVTQPEKQTKCVASCFQSERMYRPDGNDTNCMNRCEKDKFVENITSAYKGYSVFDRKCVARCSTGIYIETNGGNQCLESCPPPLVGSPSGDQFVCTNECESGQAIDKSD